MGFSGWLEYGKKTENRNGILYNMVEVLKQKDNVNRKYYQDEICNMGEIHENVLEHMETIEYKGITYVITLEGEIFNYKELVSKIELFDKNIKVNNQLESVIYSYILWGEECIEKIDGNFSFAIWNSKEEKLFMARDRLGIKPLYYCIQENNVFFSTRIKGILEHSMIEAKINNDGIAQLFGLGPAVIPGKCVFSNIYQVLPGNYMIINSKGNIQVQYWKLKNRKHVDDERTTVENVKELINNSVDNCLQDKEKIAVMLSGGLDSSIITSVLSKKIDNELDTYSVDYDESDKYFVSNDYQPDSDKKYIDLMVDKYNTKHENKVLDSEKMYNRLYDAMKARDLPGMADIDSSLLEFCKEIKKEDHKYVFSGEFADEIFAGYPWYYKDELRRVNTFPWSRNLKLRQDILNEDLDINIYEYVNNEYESFLSNLSYSDYDNDEDKLMKKLMYLNIYWFGTTLLDRAERMSDMADVIIETPFTDYKLLEYVWNIPWKYKRLGQREKGLLRSAYQDDLPYDIVYRKKSPYPKTFNPEYTNLVKNKLTEILEDETAPLLNLINKEKVMNILEGNEFDSPWFGQLMREPQFFAYLIQINMWLVEYNIKIEP